MQVERGHGVERGICADHDDIAVGKVQKQDDTIDHAVAQCHKRIHRTCLQAVKQLGNKQTHELSFLSFFFRTSDGCFHKLGAPIGRPENGFRVGSRSSPPQKPRRVMFWKSLLESGDP